MRHSMLSGVYYQRHLATEIPQGFAVQYVSIVHHQRYLGTGISAVIGLPSTHILNEITCSVTAAKTIAITIDVRHHSFTIIFQGMGTEDVAFDPLYNHAFTAFYTIKVLISVTTPPSRKQTRNVFANFQKEPETQQTDSAAKDQQQKKRCFKAGRVTVTGADLDLLAPSPLSRLLTALSRLTSTSWMCLCFFSIVLTCVTSCMAWS